MNTKFLILKRYHSVAGEMEKYPKVSVQARSSNKEVKYGKRQVQALFRWLDKDHLQLCHGDL
jgi:hypothetical protein